MPTPSSPSDVKIRALSFAEHIFDYIASAVTSGELYSRIFAGVILTALLLILIIVFCKVFLKIVEVFLKIYEAYQNSRYRLIVGNNKKKYIQKKRQFCGVLDADLAYIDKAENWNDQYFTDLEAEVEAEGGYYTSTLNKILKRKVLGIRRVSSLIKAIDTSTERAILLVGEPGSGKSVALRHLAKRLAERGKRSKDPKSPIPLYINLRELEVTNGLEVNADLIKNFVLDNIRRGDSDTSSYVKDNWSKNKDEGIWFFLFDSFDEIPAVLHSASESENVKQYSRAIRQFLDGMGDCRGVLASREYKGPNTIPWQKFRILKLDEKRQRNLVRNSFLSDERIEIVLQHLATNKSKLGNNPLFLTLLCRYVKDEGSQPKNDHQLLERHIERLTLRDTEYIFRKYGLTPYNLTAGAKILAVAFAESSELSLAPKLDEIYAVTKDKIADFDYLERLISALVDVKIGRNDVASSRPGDRRFAFSHRRYQETLFANYLCENPQHIHPAELLNDKRWREYTVAIMQSQNYPLIQPIITEATRLLSDFSKRQTICNITGGITESYGYFDWSNSDISDLLQILQEGLGQRRDEIPDSLGEAIGELLSLRWEKGDQLDRYMVIKYGGLLPKDIFTSYLESAVHSTINDFQEIAFRQSVFLIDTSEELDDKICRKLATEALSAKKTGEKLRLQALAARLPASMGAINVVKRCQKIRPVLLFLNYIAYAIWLPAAAAGALAQLIKFKHFYFFAYLRKSTPNLHYDGGWSWINSVFALPIFVLLANINQISIIEKSKKEDLDSLVSIFSEKMSITISIFYILFLMAVSLIYHKRSSKPNISLKKILVKEDFKKLGYLLGSTTAAIVIFAILTAILWLIGLCANSIFSYLDSDLKSSFGNFEIGTPIFLFPILLLMLKNNIKNKKIEKMSNEKLNSLLDGTLSDIEILSYASDLAQISTWLVNNMEFLRKEIQAIRTISSLTLRISDENSDENLLSYSMTVADKMAKGHIERLIWLRIWLEVDEVKFLSIRGGFKNQLQH